MSKVSRARVAVTWKDGPVHVTPGDGSPAWTAQTQHIVTYERQHDGTGLAVEIDGLRIGRPRRYWLWTRFKRWVRNLIWRLWPKKPEEAVPFVRIELQSRKSKDDLWNSYEFHGSLEVAEARFEMLEEGWHGQKHLRLYDAVECRELARRVADNETVHET